ncbi:TPA: hypothetical protein N3Z77_002245 [Salmonella enterica subsp. enterica serovar 14:z:e,n,x]|nr:hypothetical protein [Salmonella enterica subsp. enterica serovar 14:z:e,n,x]
MKTYEEMIEMEAIARVSLAKRELKIKKMASDITGAYRKAIGIAEYTSKNNQRSLDNEPRVFAKQENGQDRIASFATTNYGKRLDFYIVTRVSEQLHRGFYASVRIDVLDNNEGALVYVDNNQGPFQVLCDGSDGEYHEIVDAISEAAASKILSAQ